MATEKNADDAHYYHINDNKFVIIIAVVRVI